MGFRVFKDKPKARIAPSKEPSGRAASLRAAAFGPPPSNLISAGLGAGKGLRVGFKFKVHPKPYRP